MKYPRLPFYLDRRRKLMPDDIRKIRIRRKLGETIILLAKSFRVSLNTILYWTNEKIRKKILEKNRLTRKKDRQRKREIDNISKRHIRKDNPLYKEWAKEKNIKYYYKKHKNV